MSVIVFVCSLPSSPKQLTLMSFIFRDDSSWDVDIFRLHIRIRLAVRSKTEKMLEPFYFSLVGHLYMLKKWQRRGV